MVRKRSGAKADLKARKKVWETICSYPGLFPHELERIVKLRPDVLTEILKGFEEGYLVEVRIEDGKKQYFPVTTMGLEDQAILSILNEHVPKEILRFLIDSPHQTLEEIEKRLKLPRSKIEPHLDKFFRLGVIVLAKDSHKGNRTTYQIFDPERMRKLLMVKDTSLFV
jgi:predicted transcriptional regulator